MSGGFNLQWLAARFQFPGQRLKSGHDSESVAGKGDPFQSLKGGTCLVAST